MNVAERAVIFGCGEDRLVGVLTEPQRPRSLGVVIIVGGPQYRAGSHRQFVLLARTLADNGFAVLRFDCRGMGDSEGDARDFQSIADDIGAAIDTLTAQVPGVTQVALWGLCDGASAALLYLDDRPDPRIKALCLANPWVRSAAGLARTHLRHYYLQRLGQREFWAKLAGGRIGLKAVDELRRNVQLGLQQSPPDRPADAPFQDRMTRACAAFDGAVLIALSGEDFTAREFEAFARASDTWRQLLERGTVTVTTLPGADHTFSAGASRIALEQATLQTLASAAP